MNNSKRMSRFLLLLSQLSLTTFLFFFLHTIPALGYPDPTTTEASAIDFLRTSCGTTLYPDVCYTSLSHYARAVKNNPAQLAKVAIAVCLNNVRGMAAYVANITHQADYGPDPRAAAALHDCFTNFDDSVDQIRDSLRQMRQLGTAGGGSFRFKMSNVQTWMSAVLSNEDSCTDGFEDVADGPLKADMSQRVEDVKKVTSNALALVNSFVETVAP